MQNLMDRLRASGIQPTLQRLAVARVALEGGSHRTADQIWAIVRRTSPTVSRATVYNTLNLLADKGIVHPMILKEGTVIFDPNVAAHHHFIDEETGEVHDLPWDSFSVTGGSALDQYEVREFHVIVRGRRRPGPGAR